MATDGQNHALAKGGFLIRSSPLSRLRRFVPWSGLIERMTWRTNDFRAATKKLEGT